MNEIWTYKTLDFGIVPAYSVDKTLNEYGSKGWEAVGFASSSDMYGRPSGYQVLLKKRVSESTHTESHLDSTNRRSLPLDRMRNSSQGE